MVDELWVFGDTIADGVLFEIEFAKELGKPIRYYSIENKAELIRPVAPRSLKFERTVYAKTGLQKDDLLRRIIGLDTDQLLLPLQ